MKILDRDLTNVRSVRFPSIRIAREPLVFTDCDSFIRWINKEGFTVDAMTYTVGRIPVTVDRLIYQIDEHRYAKRARYAIQVNDCHIKLWLLQLDDRLKHAYVGSLNVGMSTNTNLMVRAPQPRLLAAWFNQVWHELLKHNLPVASVKKGPAEGGPV